MKCYVSVSIPVKSYVKAFMQKELGDDLKLSTGQHVIYNKLNDLLERSQDPDKLDANCSYNARIIIYISRSKFRQRGCNLNATNTRSFNKFVELMLKHRFHTLMDDLIAIRPGFERNLIIVRKRLGIDVEAWSDDSMQKDYYRSRLRRNMPLFKNKQ